MTHVTYLKFLAVISFVVYSEEERHTPMLPTMMCECSYIVHCIWNMLRMKLNQMKS
jgi:hypothetical protein